MLIFLIAGILIALGFLALFSDGEFEVMRTMALIALFVLVVTGIVSGTSLPDVARSDIVSLQDNTQDRGTFFLGIGTIEGNPAYSYYKVVGENQFKQRLLIDDSYTEVTVFQDVEEGEQPYVETVGTYKDFGCSWLACHFGGNHVDEIHFHVPKGSIKQDFVLDAQ